MASMERSGRHHPSRTIISGGFFDLGKLFDEDTKRDYMKTPEPVVRKAGEIRAPEEEMETIEEPQNESFTAEDFIIHENGVTWLTGDSTTQ